MLIDSLSTGLATERPRLLRLCTRCLGDYSLAEDAVQETLARAWRYRERRDLARPLRPWLDAIARNVCRTILSGRVATERLADESPAPGADPLSVLEKKELLHLLHDALDALPHQTREALLARYIHETPLPELARSLNTTDEALSVRLHRGREALRKSLTGSLTPPGVFPETETNLWCPACGRRRLCGGFFQSVAGARRLELRCPDCFRAHRRRFLQGEGESALGGLVSLGPAVKHTMRTAHAYWHAALAAGRGPCRRCHRPVPLVVQTNGARPNLSLVCSCGHRAEQDADGLVLSLPEVERLRVRHTRLRTLFPAPGFVRIEALQSAAAVEVRTDPVTFAPLEVRTEGIPNR